MHGIILHIVAALLLQFESDPDSKEVRGTYIKLPHRHHHHHHQQQQQQQKQQTERA